MPRSNRQESLALTQENFRSAHDKQWDMLGSDDAAFVHDALIHADQLRQMGTDADAYLETVVAERLQSQHSAQGTIRPIGELGLRPVVIVSPLSAA